MTDLILLTCGNLEVLKPCVESLFRTTHTPSRLIIVDNGSGSETKAFLRSLKDAPDVAVEIVTNEKNEGFVLGMNRGMKRSNAPYVALLNDDLIFTEGWLERLIEAGNRYPQIGLLNPSSNTFSHHPPKGWSVERYAEERKHLFPAQVTRVATVSGFCMVIKRELIQKIGYLDEAFAPFFFEDTDYSCRAATAGYQSAVVKDAYVYHHEHHSFTRFKERFEVSEIFRKSEETFNQKWGRSLRILTPLNFTPESDTHSFGSQVEILSEWSYERCFLYVPLGLGGKKDFDSLKTLTLKERSGIQFFPFSHPPFFSLFCVYRILKRWKKPIDLLFFFDERETGSLLGVIARFLRLPIFSVEGETLIIREKGQTKKISPFRFSEFPTRAREIVS